MLAIRTGNSWLGLSAAAAIATVLSVTPGHAYTPEEQQACSGDAFRLCSSEIPDVDRVTVCMIRNKAQLSPPCRAFFRSGPEPVAAGRPMSIKPASTRKPAAVKPHKSKKPAKPATT